ncbi:hypothetical protein RB195_013240 [Necator americanus]|uniref:Endonuclease/exonuclease/phosphatase domain-containing protein n=1 Tax=Necator americanus TaxID=51031 RepID=A0ABR1DV00_NECAM
MLPSKQSSSGQTSVPLILPKITDWPKEKNSSVNLFRMILDEDHRVRQEQPVVDLEADVLKLSDGIVTVSPVPKKRKEDPATDDCIILDNYENKPSSSTAVKNYDIGKPVNKKVRAIRRTSKLPWNPLEATFHVPQQVLKPSPSLISSDKVIDLNDEKRVSSAKITTIRDVLDELCVPPSPPEEGEIVESSESTETGESCVIDLTHEEELQLTLRSQVEGDVIDLTVENEVSDNESEVVCMEDLTVVDVEEVSIIQADDSTKNRRKSIEKVSFRSTVCSGIRRKPSNDDALSRGTKEVTGVTPRYWERLTGAPKLSSGNVEFRVCSYNVLCQLTTLKTMYLYRHLGEDNNPLRWENRWPMLEQELLRLNADVYGLQEVQYDHFDSHYRPAMSKVGYAAYYKQRTGGMNDGCAVFVRKSKFDVLRYRIVEYFVAAGTTMDRDQIGQVLRLRCKKTGQELIYANTHLLFNSARGDIKIGQLAMLFANIYDVIKEGTPCPVIINGDFNIEPLSYVYTYISESSVYLRGLPRNELSGQGERGGPCVQANNILPFAANIGRDSMFVDGNCLRTVAADYFTHPLCLASVYHHFRDDGKKEVSTYHKEVANPDFIFYSIEKKEMIDSMTKVYELPELRLLRRLGLPDHETLRNTLGPWPNQWVAHLQLVLYVIRYILISVPCHQCRGARPKAQLVCSSSNLKFTSVLLLDLLLYSFYERMNLLLPIGAKCLHVCLLLIYIV